MTEYTPLIIFVVIAVILIAEARIARRRRFHGSACTPGRGKSLNRRFGLILLVIGLAYVAIIAVVKHSRHERTIETFQTIELCDARQIAENIEQQIQIIQAQLRVIAREPFIGKGKTTRTGWNRLFQSCYGLMDHGWVRTLSQVDARGLIIMTLPDVSKISLDISSQPHNQLMMREHRSLVGDPFGSVQGYQAIAISEPIFHKEQFDGWVTALVDFKNLMERFKRTTRAGGIAKMGLLDRRGVILCDVTSSATTRTIGEIVKLNPESQSTAERVLHDEEGTIRFRNVVHGDGSIGAVQDRVGAFARIHLGDGNFWVAGVTADEADVLASFPNSIWTEIAIGILFLALIVLAAADRLRAERYYAEGLEREVDSGRKQAEEARHLLATVIEQSTEAIFLTDTRGMLQYVNPAFCALTGHSSGEILGRNARMALAGLRDRKLYREILECLRQGGIWRGHLTHRHRDGSVSELESAISPVRDAEGRIISYVAVNRDASLELALEAQLRQSQKMEAIGKLAGGVAHDFNNVLTAIVGNIQLAQRQGGEPVQRFLKVALKASERAAEMIRQLLTFSRKGSDVRQSVDLNDLILETVRLVEKSIDRRIHLVAELESSLPRVQADPNQLHQVIMNLCVNARDAILERFKDESRLPEQREFLTTIRSCAVTVDEEYCRLHSFAHPGRFVMLAIRDEGVGMDRETLARIFEPFFTTKAAGEGTGLGLSTVYGIVKSHNGWVHVDSTPGEGTEFEVYIPTKVSDAALSRTGETQRESTLAENGMEY